MPKQICDYFQGWLDNSKSNVCKLLHSYDPNLGEGIVAIAHNDIVLNVYEFGISYTRFNFNDKVKYSDIEKFGALTLQDIMAANSKGDPFVLVDFCLLVSGRNHEFTLPFTLYSTVYDFLHKYCHLDVVPKLSLISGSK